MTTNEVIPPQDISAIFTRFLEAPLTSPVEPKNHLEEIVLQTISNAQSGKSAAQKICLEQYSIQQERRKRLAEKEASQRIKEEDDEDDDDTLSPEEEQDATAAVFDTWRLSAALFMHAKCVRYAQLLALARQDGSTPPDILNTLEKCQRYYHLLFQLYIAKKIEGNVNIKGYEQAQNCTFMSPEDHFEMELTGLKCPPMPDESSKQDPCRLFLRYLEGAPKTLLQDLTSFKITSQEMEQLKNWLNRMATASAEFASADEQLFPKEEVVAQKVIPQIARLTGPTVAVPTTKADTAQPASEQPSVPQAAKVVFPAEIPDELFIDTNAPITVMLQRFFEITRDKSFHKIPTTAKQVQTLINKLPEHAGVLGKQYQRIFDRLVAYRDELKKKEAKKPAASVREEPKHSEGYLAKPDFNSLSLEELYAKRASYPKVIPADVYYSETRYVDYAIEVKEKELSGK